MRTQSEIILDLEQFHKELIGYWDSHEELWPNGDRYGRGVWDAVMLARPDLAQRDQQIQKEVRQFEAHHHCRFPYQGYEA